MNEKSASSMIRARLTNVVDASSRPWQPSKSMPMPTRLERRASRWFCPSMRP
ncbi:Uncharacterised protein [Mycobacteroides abscessus subsp. abscessus]|nr:Uncharacterised protein [Mycobacteroides abscessus subsp. abscessus]SKS92908.1 Uncharacterised protein [Mycobacteroides abscessus subsp. abscessus]SKU40618.1 Uncharacterised protein [Mycobacteroides abscessus subsp. abscessus]